MSERRSVLSQHEAQSSHFPALESLLFLVIINFTLQPLTEPDFGWHLRTGLDLLTHGWQLPALDPYSHTMPDWVWVEHAWLTDAIIGAIYRSLGALGVIVFFGAVTAGAWLVAGFCGRGSRWSRLGASVLSLWVALPFLGARTQMVTLLGLALFWVLLEWVRQGARFLMWLIPPVFLLWANLHGGFAAGLFLGGLAVGVSAFVRGAVDIRPQLAAYLDEPILPWRDICWLAVAMGVAGLATLLNPYGWQLHREIVASLSDRFMLETLQEWQPVSLNSLAGRSYAIYLTGLGLAMAAWYRRIEPVRWVIWAVFLILSLRHLRNIPFFLIVSLPLCAELLSGGVVDLANRLKLDPAWGRQWVLVGTLAGGLFLAWLGPDHLQRVTQSGVQPAEYFKSTSYPIEAVEWVRRHRDRLGKRLYNDYGYGGFLLWWLPDEKIFIDGRMPAWRSGDRRIFQDYVALNQSDPPQLSVLDKYAVDWTILRSKSSLAQALGRASAWKNAYEDRKVVIYVRTPE